MYSLPNDVAKQLQVRATDSTLTCRRSLRAKSANLIAAMVVLVLGGQGLSMSYRTHQMGLVVVDILLILATLYFLRVTYLSSRAQFVIDRDNDVILDQGRPVGRVSAIERIGTCHKTGVTKVVARFVDGRTIDLCPCVLAFAKDGEAEPVAYLLEEFAGVSHHLPEQTWSVSSRRETATV